MNNEKKLTTHINPVSVMRKKEAIYEETWIPGLKEVVVKEKNVL